MRVCVGHRQSNFQIPMTHSSTAAHLHFFIVLKDKVIVSVPLANCKNNDSFLNTPYLPLVNKQIVLPKLTVLDEQLSGYSNGAMF